jgi:hypothetical protein
LTIQYMRIDVVRYLLYTTIYFAREIDRITWWLNLIFLIIYIFLLDGNFKLLESFFYNVNVIVVFVLLDRGVYPFEEEVLIFWIGFLTNFVI